VICPSCPNISAHEVNLLNIGWKSLGWSAAALLLMLTVLTPLNVFTAFLIMTPFVVLYTMMRPALFAAHVAAIGIAVFLLSGSYGAIAVTLGLFFLIPALAMGHMYKKGSPARTAIVVGAIVILVQLLLELALFSWQFDINLSTELAGILTDSFMQLETSGMFEAGWAAETANAFSKAIVNALPMLLLLSSFLFAIVTHALSRVALRSVGVAAPSLPQAKTWRLPRSLVFYYLIAMIASFFLTEESSGYWTVVITNLVPILQFVFVVQAVGFFFFLADAKRWPRIVPILLCIPLFLFSHPLYLIGLLDAALPLRRYFVKS